MTALLSHLAFHHLGLAVRDDQAALSFLRGLGYRPGERLFDPEQNVQVRLCLADGRPSVEIVQPGVGPSPIDQLVNRYNEMIYHTCYETTDAASDLERIRSLGLTVQTLSAPRPAVLFGGRRVSFHRIPGLGIIELLEQGS